MIHIVMSLTALVFVFFCERPAFRVTKHCEPVTIFCAIDITKKKRAKIEKGSREEWHVF